MKSSSPAKEKGYILFTRSLTQPSITPSTPLSPFLLVRFSTMCIDVSLQAGQL